MERNEWAIHDAGSDIGELAMTYARAIEYRITRNLLARRSGPVASPETHLAERLIAIGAVTTALLLGGSYLPELVTAAIAASGLWVTAAG